MISKAVKPPWNDSSKNLVKDICLAGKRFSYTVLGTDDFRLEESFSAPHVQTEAIYRKKSTFTPPLWDNARVAMRLVAADPSAITHYFFAPNVKSSTAAMVCQKLRPRRLIQTVCSIPEQFDDAQRVLFAPTVIVLSQYTYDGFVRAGVDEHRLKLIPPGIQLIDAPKQDDVAKTRQQFGLPLDQPVIIYPGDYQFSNAAETVARAVPLLGDRNVTFVFACRIKQEASREIEQRIRGYLADAGVISQVRFFNEVPAILQLIGACDVCVLPADRLYAKMDIPLVLLEAMSMQKPIIVVDTPPLSELLSYDCGLGVPAGDPAAFAHAVRQLAHNVALRNKLGEQARRAVVTHFEISQVAKRYEDVYDDVIKRPIYEN